MQTTAANEFHDIEKAKKRRVMLVGPRGKMIVEEVDKIRSGLLMHNSDGSYMLPSYKRQFDDGRPGWQILDAANCTADELATLREWMSKDAALNGRAQPIPLEKRPRIVRERLLASMESEGFAGVLPKDKPLVEEMIAKLRASLEVDAPKGKRQ